MFDEETTLSILLNENVIFAGQKEIFHEGKSLGFTTCLFVCCNDVFAWGSADCENLPYDEIETLFKMYNDGGEYGVAKWCCKQRNEKPQYPIELKMKEDGAWEDWLDNLPDNKYSKMIGDFNAK